MVLSWEGKLEVFWNINFDLRVKLLLMFCFDEESWFIDFCLFWKKDIFLKSYYNLIFIYYLINI